MSRPPKRDPSDARRELRALQAERFTTRAEIARIRDDVERIAASRAWRFGHATARLLARIRGRRPETRGAVERALERISALERTLLIEPPATAPAPRRAERGLPARDPDELRAEIRRKLGPPPTPAEPKLVSIITVSTGRLEPLRRLASALAARTDYEPLELVVVGAGDADEVGTWLETAGLAFPAFFEPAPGVESVGALRNRGATRAAGGLLLFVDESVEPFEPGWLAELVAALDDGAVATGARLIDAAATVRHAGIRFRADGFQVRQALDDEGEDAFGEGFGVTRECPACTGSCLLVLQAPFEAVSGFDEGYRHEGEDLDLAFRLRRTGGSISCAGRALALQRESLVGGPGTDPGDARLLVRRWGPQLRRELRLDRLDRAGFWAEGGPRAALVGDSDITGPLAGALDQRGWAVARLEAGKRPPGDLDYAFVLTPGFAACGLDSRVTTIGCIAGDPDPWIEQGSLDRLDLRLAPSPSAAREIEERTGVSAEALSPVEDPDRLIELLRELELRMSFCVKVCAPSWESAPLSGDLHFAEALGRELRRRGHRVVLQTLPEWEDPAGEARDVAVVLRGRGRHTPKPGQFSVLWNISHPLEVTGEECDGYDLVCVASAAFAAELSGRTSTPVMVLEQATDPRLFHRDPDPAHAHELVFVGNSRNVKRKVLADLLPTDRDLGVYGSSWDRFLDPSHVVADHVPNHELRRIYSSAAIVLSDHWDDMRAHGFIANRVYDAVACGALVISDSVDGLNERFGGAVVTYESREELAELVERLLANPDERAARGAAGRERVLAEHTFAHRAEALVNAISERMSETGHSLRIDGANPLRS